MKLHLKSFNNPLLCLREHADRTHHITIIGHYYFHLSLSVLMTLEANVSHSLIEQLIGFQLLIYD